MGGVWANPNVDFTAAKKIVDADPADLDPQRRRTGSVPTASTKVAGMGTYLVSPQILKLVVPANADGGCVHHDGDHCHRERARDCRLGLARKRRSGPGPGPAPPPIGTQYPGGSGMRRARRAVVFMAAAFIALAGCGGPAGAGKFGDVVAADGPSPGSQVSPRGHFYLLDAKPGDTITQNVRVINPNDHAGHRDRRGGRRHHRRADRRAARHARAARRR